MRAILVRTQARRKPPTPKDVQHLLDKQKDDSLQFLSRNTDLVTTVARKHKLDPEMLQVLCPALCLMSWQTRLCTPPPTPPHPTPSV